MCSNNLAGPEQTRCHGGENGMRTTFAGKVMGLPGGHGSPIERVIMLASVNRG